MKKVSRVAAKQSRNNSQQKLTVGLDLGDRNSWYCVMDTTGQIQLEQRVRTHAKALQEVFGAMPRSRINPQYPFADAFAPDFSLTHVPLADFFSPAYLNNPRTFDKIILPPAWQSYNADYFINYFENGGLILDPDNDVADDD